VGGIHDGFPFFEMFFFIKAVIFGNDPAFVADGDRGSEEEARAGMGIARDEAIRNG